MVQIYLHSLLMNFTKSPNHFTKSGSRVFGFCPAGSTSKEQLSTLSATEKSLPVINAMLPTGVREGRCVAEITYLHVAQCLTILSDSIP